MGTFGLISRWNGTEWRKADSPTSAHLCGLHVESPDEMYAVARNGMVLAGTRCAWTQRVVTDDYQLHDVAKFADKVWVAAGDKGLLLLEEDKLVLEWDDIPATRLDAADELLVTSSDATFSSDDSVEFNEWSDGSVVELMDDNPLS